MPVSSWFSAPNLQILRQNRYCVRTSWLFAPNLQILRQNRHGFLLLVHPHTVIVQCSAQILYTMTVQCTDTVSELPDFLHLTYRYCVRTDLAFFFLCTSYSHRPVTPWLLCINEQSLLKVCTLLIFRQSQQSRLTVLPRHTYQLKSETSNLMFAVKSHMKASLDPDLACST